MRHSQDKPPAKRQLKAWPCEGLSAVPPEKQPCGRVKRKMKSLHWTFDNALLEVYKEENERGKTHTCLSVIKSSQLS